ncbi:MAG TPA: alpha/beta hydrolase [Candidatus Saccharimonadales bacterium]|nr:alpha/beta hydrolase [Candidatus Saccharimonadales bacterium]
MKHCSDLVGSTRVHYLLAGTEHDSTVVLLHGLGMSPSLYEDLGEELAKSHLVVIPDLNGLGDGWQIVSALEELAEKYGWGRVDIVAHSMGGLVALRWVVVFPERFGKIVANSIAGEKVNRSLIGWLGAALRKNRRNFGRNKVKALQIVLSFVRNSLLHPFWMWEAFQITTQSDVVRQIKLVEVPIDLVWSDDDEYFPNCWEMRRALRQDPVIVRNAGHDWIILEPERAASIIESLLN